MNINKTDYLFRGYARIHVFLHPKKDIMNYSDSGRISCGLMVLYILL